MKPYLKLCLLLLFSTLSLKTEAQEAYTLFDAKGKAIDFKTVLKQLEGKSHIFFGEHHNNAIAHWLQLELTKALHQQRGSNLVIGMEMFEADTQLLIDEYFANVIKEKSFESDSRLWKNYQTDYKPIVAYAHKNKLKLLATNVPRRYANAVFNQGPGILQQLSPEAKAYMAPLPIIIDTNQVSYKAIQKMSGGHGSSNLLESQALKDATMAHFIILNTKENTTLLHLNGSYHSDRKEGIVTYVKAKIPQQKILTITTVSQDQVEVLNIENQQLADIIICVNSEMTSTH